jgi:hypothetical protein
MIIIIIIITIIYCELCGWAPMKEKRRGGGLD